jgi:hypothetical protein
MKKYLKHLKGKNSDEDIKEAESLVIKHINKLQKETFLDLNMPLKDFVIARR